MALTGKQKRVLKQAGQTMPDTCHLGKEGVTEAFIDHVMMHFSRRELIKVRFAELEGSARKELATALADALDAELVGVVGRTLLLYRANPTLDANARLLVRSEK